MAMTQLAWVGMVGTRLHCRVLRGRGMIFIGGLKTGLNHGARRIAPAGIHRIIITKAAGGVTKIRGRGAMATALLIGIVGTTTRWGSEIKIGMVVEVVVVATGGGRIVTEDGNFVLGLYYPLCYE